MAKDCTVVHSSRLGAGTSDSKMKETTLKWMPDGFLLTLSLDGKVEEYMIHQGNGSVTTKLHAPADQVEDVEHERLMDRRMYMEATQGNVNGFIQILLSISSEKKLPHSKILCQVSPQNNTCLHIAASFGHHYLASYILRKCPDLIKKQNSDGDTALHVAARTKDLSFVKFVIDSCPSGSGASQDVEKAEPSLLRIVNKEENTVLHEALIHHCKQKEVVEVLIKADPQVAYYPNKEGKSPLYLAAEAHYFDVVKAIGKSKVEESIKNRDREAMPAVHGANLGKNKAAEAHYFHVVKAIGESEVVESIKNRDREAMPAVHGAILGKNKKMLEKILAMKLVHQKDKDGSTPLHIAASIGYLEGVRTLLGQSNFDRYQRDKEGLCPIHVASRRGYVDIVKELLQFSPDSKELLIKGRENFLHVAAKYGKENVVNFVLKEKGLENLINAKNSYGNTPLHLATMHEHPKVVNYLTWNKRVEVNLVNGEGHTAFDIAINALSGKNPPTFHQRLIRTALKSAGARPTRNSKVPLNKEMYEDRVNTLLLVSALIATVTFAAGFTMPGGYNSSDPNAGMATLLVRNMFHMFVICNTIAMYTSIIAANTLIWAQLGDPNLMDSALKWALPLLVLALTEMSLGFMAAVYVVVSSLHWLANVVLIIGIIGLVSLLIPIILLYLPSKYTNCILRCISYYPFLVLAWASKTPEH